MAYEIVKRLKKQSHHELLAVLSSGVRENELKKGKKHQVFRLSFDGLVVKGEKEINRVLDYIHFNPVRGKWRLVEDYVEYPYSSAGFYELGRPNEFGIVDYRSILYPETDQRLLLSRTLGVRTQSPLASDSEPEEKPRRMPDI